MLAGALPRACGGEPCPVLAGAALECAGLGQAVSRGRRLRRAAWVAAVLLHVVLFVLVVFLETLPLVEDPPLVCILDLDAVLPGEPGPPAAVAPAPQPEPAPRPAPKPKPKARPRPAPSPVEQPVSVRESGPARPAETAPAPAPDTAPEAGKAAAKPAAPAGSPAAPPARPGRSGRGFELSEVDTPPRVFRSIEPEYPYAARRHNLTGTVTVRFLVDEAGRVEEVSVLAADPPGVFEQSVLRAVRRWRFSPGERGGKPVPTWVVLPVRFDLAR